MKLDFLRNSTVLISGATGMIGSQLVRKLLSYNHKFDANITVIALYRDEEKKKRIFCDQSNNASIRWFCHDVCQPVEWMEEIDFIIHTAGITGGSKQHVDFPVRTIMTAIKGTVNLLELAKDKSIRGFVYLSSLEIYGETEFNMTSISENDRGYVDSMEVRSSYSESKRICENLCVAYAKQYGVPTKVVRLTATYGAGANYKDNRVLCEFARNIIERKDIVLRSMGETVRNYCDVSDAVNAILLVLEKGKVAEAYNVANMEMWISIKEMAERFIFLYPESAVQLRFDLLDDVTALGYNKIRKICLNTEKLEALGWKPKVGLDQMIRNLVRAMAEAKNFAC